MIMRGFGFPAHSRLTTDHDVEKLVRDLPNWIAQGIPFLIHCDGGQVTGVVADAFERTEVMAAAAGFKVLP